MSLQAELFDYLYEEKLISGEEYQQGINVSNTILTTMIKKELTPYKGREASGIPYFLGKLKDRKRELGTDRARKTGNWISDARYPCLSCNCLYSKKLNTPSAGWLGAGQHLLYVTFVGFAFRAEVDLTHRRQIPEPQEPYSIFGDLFQSPAESRRHRIV